MQSDTFTFDTLPKQLPDSGIYVFSEGEKHLYVGRSNRLRKRLQNHCRQGSTHLQAAFAFRLAREASGFVKATYKFSGSRQQLMRDMTFMQAFADAKNRLRAMQIRAVAEDDPLRQALLEMYVAVCLKTPYNDFDNH